MYPSKKSGPLVVALIAIAALSTAPGCTEPEDGSPRRHTGSTPSPELAGAWYQIFFDSNKTEIDERGRMIVQNVAYVVAHDDTTRVTVIGKTDRIGSASSNLSLSEKRADQVRNALVAAGVPSARIDTSWTGEKGQGVETPSSAAEHHDRAVDITVVKQPHRQ
ncbi:OmpA family protein [Magnetospirillum molischianum]|uniref:Outer membrane protein and related peptidoglycan-associated (Lipo)proteins n=1 Tax=Magnetospirillum molischianum DSM 120 TaxID=1150626 RepID=H8FVK0_MAGML|nr:OmpA family protein [Magnetospirillum molischianum]CCG42388.1 Outer membrane protein and related peptidoglycan-associated (Lipo)proteins [Magnetospirillum molischianum DSM 120]